LPEVLGWSGVADAITKHLRHGLLLPKRCTLWGACVDRLSDCMFAASLMLVLATPNDEQHMQRVFIVAAVQITLPTPARHPLEPHAKILVKTRRPQ
jgi:hypothetical protein